MDFPSVMFRTTTVLMSAIVAGASPDSARPRAEDRDPETFIRLRYTAVWNAPDADGVRTERGEILFQPRERLVLRRMDDFPEAVWLTSGRDAGCEVPEWVSWIGPALRVNPAPPPPESEWSDPAAPLEPARLRDSCARPPAEGPVIDVLEAGDAPEWRLPPEPGSPAGEAWIRDVDKGRELRIRLPDGGRWVVRLAEASDE